MGTRTRRRKKPAERGQDGFQLYVIILGVNHQNMTPIPKKSEPCIKHKLYVLWRSYVYVSNIYSIHNGTLE